MRKLVLVSLLLVVGCAKKLEPEITITSEERKLRQIDDETYDAICIDVRPKDTNGTFVSSHQIVGKEAVGDNCYRADSFPIGKSKVKLKIKGDTKSLLKKHNDVVLEKEVEVERK